MTSHTIRGILFSASAVALAAGLATPASAQRIDNIVVFGDSYADTGNAVAILLNNPMVPQATKDQLNTVYSTGRFSGGTNYIDTLADLLQASVENYAVGGALTGTGNVTPGLPGFTQETGIFLSGSVPPGTFFPVSDRAFEENDLLAVSIGGNDARAYQSGGGTLAGAAAGGTAAAATATANLNQLVGAGAQTISFLAGDTGRLPEIAGNPTGAQIRSTFSTSFNAAMQGTLAGYAANGVMVHYLDLNLLLDNVSADPAAFGINNGLVCPIFPNPTCILNAGGYLFYGDALHLTSDGFKIVAQYVAAQLTAPLTLGAPTDVALGVAQQFGRTLTTRMDFGSPRDGEVAEGLQFFVLGDTYSRSIAATSTNDRIESSSTGGTIGIQYGLGNAVVGLAGNYSMAEGDFTNNAAGIDTDSWQVGAFAGTAIGPIFAQGYLGYGWDDHDITRGGVVENMTADTDGTHWLAGAKAGYLTLVGPVRLGPVVALDYARAKVDGYTEEGDPVLNLNVGSIDLDSLRGSAGIEVRGDFAPGGARFRPYGVLTVEKELSGGDRSVSFSQTSSPGIVNSFSYERTSRKAYARLAGGLAAEIAGNLSIDAGVNMTFGKKHGNETGGHLGVRLGF